MTRKMASAGLRSWGEVAAAAKNRTNWKKAGRVCCGDAVWHTSFSKINTIKIKYYGNIFSLIACSP